MLSFSSKTNDLFSLKIQKPTAQKMKSFIKEFFSKCDDLVTFIEEILIGKLHFLCSGPILSCFQLLLGNFPTILIFLNNSAVSLDPLWFNFRYNT